MATSGRSIRLIIAAQKMRPYRFASILAMKAARAAAQRSGSSQ